MSMPMRTLLRRNGTLTGNVSLLSLIEDEIQTERYRRLSACAAYASYRGVTLIRSAFGGEIPNSRWVFGLDDGITDPQAIRVAMGMFGAKTRVVNVTGGKRFHPKAYLLDGNARSRATLIIGSTNLTQAALERNCEVFAVFKARRETAVTQLRSYWNAFWKMGVLATAEAVQRYDETRKRSPYRDPSVEEEASDRPQTTATQRIVKNTLGSSNRAWIVLGKNTGGGGQLDIVKKLAPFLGLPSIPREGKTVFLRMNSPLGARDFQLTFTKGMWRFMNLQQGFSNVLRPDLSKPSPYLLVLTRLQGSNELSIDIARLDSRNTRQIIENSQSKGFVDSSVPGRSGRLFGWY